MAVKLKDIASELNLSVPLISQVLNGNAKQLKIKKETAALVTKKAKELGYVSNKIARGLRTKRTNTIALLTPDLADPFFAQIAKVVQNELHRLGYNLMVLESHDETSKEIEEINLLEANGIDGMLIIPVGDEYLHIENLSKKNYPVVLLYRTFKEIDANTITIEHYINSFTIVSSLIEKGHTKIGLLQGKSIRFANSERLRGYKDALKKNNIDFIDDYIIKKGFYRQHGYKGTKQLLSLPSPPTALILNSDLQTLGSLQAIKENKLKIPDDIVLVATNILHIERSLFVPISTVCHPVEELGKIAVKTLLDDINNSGKNKKVKVVLKSKLNIDGSVYLLDFSKNNKISIQ